MLTFRLILCCCISAAVGTESSSDWERTRDDLNGEYTALGVQAATSERQCTFLGMCEADAVQFDEAMMLCRLFVCRGGWSGCRKCRNADNSSLPQIWARKLGNQSSCWRTFQHRVDASVDFNRNWTSFVSGFGQGENANFWIGLESLHLMTRDSALPVRWEFSDWNNTLYWMENAFFQVGNSTTKYRVSVGEQLMDRSTVTQCSVSSTSDMNNQKFSTWDQDNDSLGSGNCATIFKGGWWMQRCFCMNPNGPYVNPPDALYLTSNAEGIALKNDALIFPWNNRYSLKTFECLRMVNKCGGSKYCS